MPAKPAVRAKVTRHAYNQGVDVMRSISVEEISSISGGELVCTVTVSATPSASCTGGESDWMAAGEKVWNFLAASPFTVPGIVERIS